MTPLKILLFLPLPKPPSSCCNLLCTSLTALVAVQPEADLLRNWASFTCKLPNSNPVLVFFTVCTAECADLPELLQQNTHFETLCLSLYPRYSILSMCGVMNQKIINICYCSHFSANNNGIQPIIIRLQRKAGFLPISHFWHIA